MDEKGRKWLWVLLPLVVGLVTPSLIILALDVFVAGTSVGTAAGSVLSRQFAEGHNLFLLAAFGLIPFALLSLILLLVARSERNRGRLPGLSITGMIGALALMIPSHVSVWFPLYGGGHMSSTAVIAFLFIPFLCCVTMGLGLLIGVLATRRRVAAEA